jgi:hypothetical protein
MKKNSKQKTVSAFKSRQTATVSLESILRDAYNFPILECWISDDWEKGTGLVQIMLARQQPNGKICCGVYLVDYFCLGLKNTFAKVNLSPDRYHELYDQVFSDPKAQECPIELAHQMIYASIDYAAQFGFQSHKDFALTRYMLKPHGELDEPYELTFGQDGKPFFIAGPRDDPKKIIKQLEATAGPGNFDYLAQIF